MKFPSKWIQLLIVQANYPFDVIYAESHVVPAHQWRNESYDSHIKDHSSIKLNVKVVVGHVGVQPANLRMRKISGSIADACGISMTTTGEQQVFKGSLTPWLIARLITWPLLPTYWTLWWDYANESRDSSRLSWKNCFHLAVNEQVGRRLTVYPATPRFVVVLFVTGAHNELSEESGAVHMQMSGLLSDSNRGYVQHLNWF